MKPLFSGPRTGAETGQIAADWSAIFVSDDDGWRFQQWARLKEGGQEPPAITPEHLALRFTTLDDALEFFRREYGKG